MNRRERLKRAKQLFSILMSSVVIMLLSISLIDLHAPPAQEANTAEYTEAVTICTEVEAPPQPRFTEAELELVARVVATESRGEPYEGQCAVAQVIYDRYMLEDKRFGKSISEILCRPNQFAKPFKGDLNSYPKTIAAVNAVFVDEYRVFEPVTVYFYNPKTAQASAKRWLETMPYIGHINNHIFRGLKK